MQPKLVLDTGALLAVERGDRDTVLLLATEHLSGRTPVTHGGVVGQVWRGGARQARLARALRAVDVVGLGRSLGREAGTLLGAAGTVDVVDAAVVCLAVDGDTIVTSDPKDLAHLLAVAGVDVRLITV